MATIFGKVSGSKGPAGKLIRNKQDDDPVQVLKIQGLDLDEFLMATSISFSNSQVVQYLKTLNGHIYGYAWGHDVGTVRAAGIALFTPECTFDSSHAGKIKKFYEDSNVYDRTEPVEITLGEISFQAYLKSYALTLDVDQYNMGKFELTFDILPKPKI